MKTSLTGREFRTILVVARQTYGWHKKEDAISLTSIAKFIGLSHKANVSSVIKSLTERRILTVIGRGNRGCKKYCINHKLHEWKLDTTVIKDDNGYHAQQPYGYHPEQRGSLSTITKGLSSTVTTKEKTNLTKENGPQGEKVSGMESLDVIINRVTSKIEKAADS